MSVVTDKILQGEASECFEVKSECFYCGEKLLKSPFVMWSGHSGQIWLHPDCVAPLFICLARDVHQCKVINKTK